MTQAKEKILQEASKIIGKSRTGPLGGEVLAIELGAINMYREKPLMIQRYNMLTTYGMAGYTANPDEHGEWVKWTDVRDEIRRLKLKLEDHHLTDTSKPKCLKLIHIPGTRGIASTYCMLDEGHTGDCV